MPDINPDQLTGQGTRLSEQAPWETYESEMTEQLDPKLQAEVDEYSQRRHTRSSSQNEEELAKQKELNAGIAKEYQWLTPEEYAAEGPRIGTVLSHESFIGKLRHAGVRCWYRQHPHPDKATFLYSNAGGTLTPQVGCWVQRGLMPEYSLMRFDDHGVPVNERRRGWRTCLLQLILKGVLTEAEAHEEFGSATGPASERYLSTLYAFRNRDSEWDKDKTEEK